MARKDFSKLAAAQAAASRITPKQVLDTSRAAMDRYIRQKQAAQLARRQAEQEADDLYTQTVKRYFSQPDLPTRQLYAQTLKKGYANVTPQELAPLLDGSANKVAGSAWDYMTGGGRTALDRATVDKYDFLRQYQHEGVFNTERNIQTGNTSLLTDAYMQDMLQKYQEAEAKQTQQVRQQTYINQMASKNPQSEYTRQLLNQLPNYLPSGENAYDVIYDTAFAQSNNFEANDQALTTILDHLLTWDSVSNGTTKRTVDELMDIEDDDEFFREVNRLYNQASGREWVASELPEQKPYDLWVDSLEGQLARNEQEQAIVAQAYEDPEFLAKSEYDAAGYNAAYMLDESGNWRGKMYSPTDYLLYARGTDDKLYHYINGNYAPMARDAYYSTDYTNKGYHLLTSDEKAVYNYYYQQSPEEAKAYLDLIQPKLMARRADAEAKQDELYATDPIMAAPTFIAGALATPLDALTGLGKAAMALSGNDDPNAPIHRLSQYKSNTAGARQAAINELEWGGLEKGLGLLDTAATSGADMAVSIGMGMALGGAGVPLAVGTTAGGLMAAEAASADLTETASDDMSDVARVARALAVGSLEMLTEKYSIDELLKTPKTLRGYLTKNILTNASEEAESSVGKTLVDEIISSIDGSKSDLKEQVDQLTAAGVENAGQKVMQGFVEGVAYEALAGGATGGLMAAGPAAATYTGRRQTGKAVVKSENVDNLISIGQSMDSTTASKELADAMAKGRDSKKKTSLADLGRLHATLLEDLNSEYHETIKQQTTDAVAQELENTLQELDHELEQGYSVKELAEGIVALAGDGKMNNGAKVPTKLERYIRTHQSTMITLREMNDGASDLKSRIQLERMNASINYAERVKAVEETAKKPEEAAEEKAPPETTEAETGTRAEEISGEIGDEVAKLTRNRPKVGTFSRLVDLADADGTTRQARVVGAKHAGGELQVIVENEEGGRETVAYDDIDAAEDEGVASVLAYAERHSETTEEEVELMLQQIENGNDAATVIGDVTDAYDAGALGLEMPLVEAASEESADSEANTAPGAPAAWRVQLREEAYAMGQRAAETAETARLAGTAARSRGKGTVLYMGDVGNTTQVDDSGTRQKVQRIEERLTDDQRAQVKTLEQIAKVTKMDFVLFESSAQEGEELVTPTGWYDSGSNQLYIDLNSGASRGGETMVNYAILKTAAHEMTHFIENNSADEYARLRNHARQLLQEQGKDYLQMVRGHMGGERGLSRNAAEAETIADACEMMLQNTEAVKALAQRDPGLVGKIKEFVQAFVRRIRKAMASLTATSEEAKALTVVRDGVERYIGDLQQMWDDALVAASTKKNEVKVEKKEAGSDKQYSYAGRESKSKDRTKLAIANEMELNGEDKEVIRKETGWFRGMDGQWRYEIDDSQATVVSKRVRDDGIELPDVLEHEKLYAAYPFLRRVRIYLSDMEGGALGKYNGQNIVLNTREFTGMTKKEQQEYEALFNTPEYKKHKEEWEAIASDDTKEWEEIQERLDVLEEEFEFTEVGERMQQLLRIGRMNRDLLRADERLKSLLLHEIQHAIQDYEEFAQGASVSWWAWNDIEIASHAPIIRKTMSRMHELIEEAPAELAQIMVDAVTLKKEFDAAADDWASAETDDEFHNAAQRVNELAEKRTENEKKAKQYPQGEDLLHEYILLTGALDKAEQKNHLMTNEEKYMNTAGEIEARDVQARMNYTEEQRQAVRPHNEVNAVFVENPFKRQYSDRRSAPSMRQTLAAMTITEDMNQTEKYLLGKYKGYAEELTQVQAEMQAQNDIQQNADMPQEERVKAANRIGILRKRARHLEKMMRTAEGNEGFMRLMDTSRSMVRRVMNAGSYEEAAQNVSRQVAEAQANLAAAQEELAALGEEKQQELARALFDPKQLKEAAKSLKDSYGSRMSQKAIQNRLAMMYTDLYAGDAESGTRHYDALHALAEDLIKTSKGQSNERLQMLKEGIGTIRLTDVQKQELKKRGISMQAFRSVVNPVVTITNSDTASDLMAALGSSEYFGIGEANGVQALFEGYENEGDAIVRLYELIQAERESGLTADGMTEEQAVQAAMVDIVEQSALPYPGDGAAEATRRAILSAADASQQVQKRLDEAVKKINISSNAAWEAKLRAERDKGNVQAVADYYRKLENQRRAMEVAEETERIQQQLTREKDNQLAEYFQRRELQEGNASLKRQIQRMVGWMDKRIRKETDQKRIPEQFKPVVEEMVRIFINANDTMRIFSRKEIAGIAYVYNQLAAIDGTDIHQLDDMYTENIEDLLEDLKASIKLFSAAEATQGEVYRMSAKHQCLEDILDVVQAVWKITQDIDTTFIDGQRVSLTQTAAQLVKEAEGKADYSRKKGAAGKAWEAIKKEIRNGNLTPVYFFKMLGLDTMTKLNEDFGNAEEKHAFLHDDAHKRLMSIMEKHNYWDWKDDEPLTFTTLQGQETDAGKHTISLKKGEALLVYATWKREHSGNPLITSSHLENGGFTLASGIQEKDGREYADGTPHRLSEADMRTIGTYLTEEQKAFADEIVEYLSQEIGELGNETSMKLFGIRKFKEAYYIPMRVQRDQLAQRSDAGARRGSDTNRIAHMSASKRRVDQARKPLVIGDFMDVVAQHVDQMLLYNTFAIPIENMNRILNQNYVEGTDSTMTGRALIKQKYGEDVAAYLSRYIADLNGGPQKDNVEKSIWSKGFSLYKKSAVVASLSVAVQQPTSVIRAMMEVNQKYFVPIANHKDNVNWGKEWEQLKQYSGVALIKERGGFDMTSGRGTAEALKGNREDNYKFWAKARLALLAGDAKGAERWKAAGRQWENTFGWLAQKADQITWAYMWRAVKAETEAKNPGMDTSSEAFLQEAGRRFSEVMRLTQVYDSTLVRSQNMRSNTVFAKMATSFMAEPTLTANILLDAVQSKDMKKIAKATGNFVISAIVTAAAAGLMKAGRDDDQSKPWVEKWMASIGNQLGGWSGSLNPLALVPGLRDVMSLMDGYDIERADMSLIDDLLEVGNKLFSGKYDEDPMKGVEDVITNAANMLGIPVKNLMRDAKMLVYTVTGLADPPREANALVMANDALKNFTYRPFFAPDTSISAYYKKLYDAMKAGNAQKQEELLEYMRIQGKDEQAINTGVRKVVEEKLATGGLTEEEAKAYLLQNGLAETEKDAYEYVEKWLYKQENGGTDGFSMYNDFYAAVESGKNLKKTVDMYLKMGVEAKTLASRITSEYKQQYINLVKTNRSAAAQLQVRLLTAYQALGYDRDKKLKDIQKWLEE